MTATGFVSPNNDDFSDDAEGVKDMIYFTLDQVDGLVAAIHSGQLRGLDAAMHLQLATRSATSDFSLLNTLYRDEINEASSERYEMSTMLAYALRQGEKAREAFDAIEFHEEGATPKKQFIGIRKDCDDRVQFFRKACNDGLDSAFEEMQGPGPDWGLLA